MDASLESCKTTRMNIIKNHLPSCLLNEKVYELIRNEIISAWRDGWIAYALRVDPKNRIDEREEGIKMEPIPKGAMLEITWLDSKGSGEHSWVYTDDLPEMPTPVLVQSLGYLHDENDEGITLVHNRAITEQICGWIVIPKKSIKNTKILGYQAVDIK